jgi:hypothetical protein
MQSITIDIPEPVFVALKRQADDQRRSIQEVAREVLTSNVPLDDGLPPALAQELAEMMHKGDAELWELAQIRVPAEDSDRLDEIHYRRSAGIAAPEERTEELRLIEVCNRVMLVRAQAAALLKQRGHDVSFLGPER